MPGMDSNPNHIKIAPSILSADFAHLGEQLVAAERGGADAVHVDVMDGRFVPNITIGPLVVEAVRRSTTLPLHVHLMIEEPARYVQDFISAGADVLIVHQEGNRTLNRLVESIKEQGAQAGLALNPSTSLAVIDEILPYVDLVLAMTVDPGFGGQKFIPTMYDKVRRLRRMATDREMIGLDVEVDGGVNAKSARLLAEAGANILVAGAAIFASGRPVEEAITELRAAAMGLPAENVRRRPG